LIKRFAPGERRKGRQRRSQQQQLLRIGKTSNRTVDSASVEMEKTFPLASSIVIEKYQGEVQTFVFLKQNKASTRRKRE
jgi:hypothetical protein